MNTEGQTPPVEIYEVDETVLVSNMMEIKLQNMSLEPFYPVMDKSVTIQSYPHVYFNQEHLSIIRIEPDGVTINTSIETIDSPNYEVGYIVEKSDPPKQTNAPYRMDISESKIYPGDHEKKFIIVRFTITNTGSKTIHPKEIPFFIELENESQYFFDHLFADTVISQLPPDALKPKESSQFQWIALVPSDIKLAYLGYENRKIKWDFK